MEVSPEHWSISDYITVSGILSAMLVWFWKKPLKAIINILQAPGRIESIDKKLDLILGSVEMTTEMLRATWRVLDRPIWQADANGMCIHANPAMLKLLGVQEEEILGNGWQNIIYIDDRDKVTAEWNNSIRNQRDFSLSYRWVSNSGVPIPIIAYASRLMNAKGNVLGWVGFAQVAHS